MRDTQARLLYHVHVTPAVFCESGLNARLRVRRDNDRRGHAEAIAEIDGENFERRSLTVKVAEEWRGDSDPRGDVGTTPQRRSWLGPWPLTRRRQRAGRRGRAAPIGPGSDTNSPQRRCAARGNSGSTWGRPREPRGPNRVPTAISSLLRSLLFRGAVKRLDTPRNGQRIGTSRSRSSFKLVGGHPSSGQTPDIGHRTSGIGRRQTAGAKSGRCSGSSSEFRPNHARPYLSLLRLGRGSSRPRGADAANALGARAFAVRNALARRYRAIQASSLTRERLPTLAQPSTTPSFMR